MEIDVCGLVLRSEDDGVFIGAVEANSGFTIPYELVDLVREALATVKKTS